MNQTGRGYTMPLVVNRRKRFGGAAWFLILIFAAYVVPAIRETPEKYVLKVRIMQCVLPLFALVTFWEASECFAKLHFVPEGIAITLGKWTIRRVPVEQIRFLGGVRYQNKYALSDLIAVCPKTMEEMAELQAEKTPKMFQNSRSVSGWTEDMAAKYVIRRSSPYRRRMPGILWIEWSPDRLRKLQAMYPHAQWLDCTDKKLFDSQLSN